MWEFLFWNGVALDHHNFSENSRVYSRRLCQTNWTSGRVFRSKNSSIYAALSRSKPWTRHFRLPVNHSRIPHTTKHRVRSHLGSLENRKLRDGRWRRLGNVRLRSAEGQRKSCRRDGPGEAKRRALVDEKEVLKKTNSTSKTGVVPKHELFDTSGLYA
ncbi:hypothetical protein GALMADRAFT_729624 [Galerina marginata CBS 339.88]|uniref:Uncharacterized protein n=1 Tax=Galerina marginata (strain CBS 339.88) TaxID=685588 RepID=A0A067T054_GALM3|nr:hypothetical protein GALMADRAFT_729624 [Galerina marginata CBS 339.88]